MWRRRTNRAAGTRMRGVLTARWWRWRTVPPRTGSGRVGIIAVMRWWLCRMRWRRVVRMMRLVSVRILLGRMRHRVLRMGVRRRMTVRRRADGRRRSHRGGSHCLRMPKHILVVSRLGFFLIAVNNIPLPLIAQHHLDSFFPRFLTGCFRVFLLLRWRLLDFRCVFGGCTIYGNRLRFSLHLWLMF